MKKRGGWRRNGVVLGPPGPGGRLTWPPVWLRPAAPTPQGRPPRLPCRPPPNPAQALAAHAEALALLDRAEAAERRPARRNVLAVYRNLVADYLRHGDPLLLEAPAAVRALLARWR